MKINKEISWKIQQSMDSGSGSYFSVHSNCLEEANKMKEENDALKNKLRSLNETINSRDDEIVQLKTNNREKANKRIDPHLFCSKDSFDGNLI